MTNTTLVLDTTHSSVDFSVKHMMFATVKGTFEDFSAELTLDTKDLTNGNIAFSVKTASVNTKNEDRDNHLKGEDFFNSEKYPEMTFRATKTEKASNDTYKVTGDFTLRDVTRPETFTVTVEGEGKDPWGNTKVAFSVDGFIKRSAYGLTWNTTLEAGGVLVGDDIKIALQVQAIKEA